MTAINDLLVAIGQGRITEEMAANILAEVFKEGPVVDLVMGAQRKLTAKELYENWVRYCMDTEADEAARTGGLIRDPAWHGRTCEDMLNPPRPPYQSQNARATQQFIDSLDKKS